MTRNLSRRRFLTISAAAAGLSLAPSALVRADAPLLGWRGTALGAQASILLHHPDQQAAQRLIDACVDEIARLERVFSLYRADSAISALNRAGALDAPPFDLVRLLSDCRRFSEQTEGAFDATVQPLWRLYAEHFARADADPAGPNEAALARALALVDHDGIVVYPQRIAFARRGMAVTLNGIAQGYITDRVADLLRANGIENVLIDLGEIRGLGVHPSGRAWQVGLQDPRSSAEVARTLEITNAAVATSMPKGTPLEASGRIHHLFDPRTGRSAHHHLSVSVVAPDATTADALSTALAVTPLSRAERILGRFADASAFFTRADGEVRRLDVGQHHPRSIPVTS